MPDFHITPPALNRNRHLTQTRLGLLMLVTFVIALNLTPIIRVEGQSQTTPTPIITSSGALETQLAEAQSALATSDASLRDAWDRQALFYADLSRQQLEEGYVHNALNLALESLAHYDDGILHAESSRALINALDVPAQEIAYFPFDDGTSGAVWSQDETRVLTWSPDGTVHIWNSDTSENILTLQHEDGVGVLGAAWNGDESRVLTRSTDNIARVWDAENGVKLVTLTHDDSVSHARWSRYENHILSWSDDSTVRVWDAATGTPLLTLRHNNSVWGAVWNEDERRILSWSKDNTIRVWDAVTGAE